MPKVIKKKLLNKDRYDLLVYEIEALGSVGGDKVTIVKELYDIYNVTSLHDLSSQQFFQALESIRRLRENLLRVKYKV